MKTWTTKNGQKIYHVLSGRCNCYLLSYNSRHILIDTGIENARSRLCKGLAQLNVNSSSLSALILTHSHFDHAENAAYIKKEFNTKIIIHKAEKDYLTKGENPSIHGTMFFNRFISEGLSGWVLKRFFRYKPAEYDIILEDEYDLKDMGFNARVIHTPGHTIGSVCVIVDNEIAVAGDTLYTVFKGLAFPPFANDERQLIKSWERLLNTGCSLFFPGHGAACTRDVLQRQFNRYKRKFGL